MNLDPYSFSSCTANAYNADNHHCILVENVKTIDEKQVELYVLFGELAYINYSFIGNHYYFLVYLDCRDAKRALPCISKMTMLNGLSGARVSTRFASVDEISIKCHDNQLHSKLSASIIIHYLQGYNQSNLNMMDVRILHDLMGQVSHYEWQSNDCLLVTWFSIDSKVKALEELNVEYSNLAIPVVIADAGIKQQPLYSPYSPTTTSNSYSYSPTTAASTTFYHHEVTQEEENIAPHQLQQSFFQPPPQQPSQVYVHPQVQQYQTSPQSLPNRIVPRRDNNFNTKRNDVIMNRMISSTDSRTTLMLKNIPNRYTQKMMIDYLNETHFGEYNFLYLRMDYENHCNVGYAFINMVNLSTAATLVERIEGKSWPRFNSNKIGQVTYAEIQGIQALITKFESSDVMQQDEKYQPKLFHTSGNMTGMEKPFYYVKRHGKKNTRK